MGTACHHYKETGEEVGDFPRPLTERHDACIALLKKKVALSGIDRKRWWPVTDGVHEYTFAFNVFTYELRKYDGERKFADEWKAAFKALNEVKHEWVTGTIDWLAKRNGRWHVDDLKTGAFPVDAETSKQLRTYALVAWLLDGRPDNWVVDVSITQWGKYPLAGEPKRQWHQLNSFDLAEHMQDLQWVLTHPEQVNPVSYGPPQPNPETGKYAFGEKLPHCSGCECREPVPHVSGWITSFWYRTLPHCFEGMKKRING